MNRSMPSAWIVLVLMPAILSAQTQPQPGPVPQAPALTFKQLTADTAVKTPSGATFTVSSGWHLAETSNLIVIQEPEKELAAAFAEVVAPTVEEAIAEAWKRWKPDFSRTIRQTTKPPATQGWDEVAQIGYETTADERRIILGAARRKDKTYYITLVDGAVGAAERRGAQLNIAIGSLKVAGRAEENLADRKAQPLDAARAQQFLAFAEQARKVAGIPGAAIAATYPPEATIRLLYWKVSPKPVVGFIARTSSMRDVGVDPFDSKMNSMSHLGSPVHAHIVCAIVTRAVASGSPSANVGKSLVMGVSHAKVLRSTSRAIISDVSGLVIEPIMNNVEGVTGSFVPSSRTPRPFSSTILPS